MLLQMKKKTIQKRYWRRKAKKRFFNIKHKGNLKEANRIFLHLLILHESKKPSTHFRNFRRFVCCTWSNGRARIKGKNSCRESSNI